MKRKNMEKKILMGLFLFYLVSMTWIIVFKMEFSFRELTIGTRTLNLIPFGGALIVNGKLDVTEMIQNVLIFCPFGIYAGVLWRKWNVRDKILAFFMVSFLYEAIQYGFAIGRADITDLIENTFGGILGLAVYALIHCICQKKEERTQKVILFCAALASAAMAGLLAVLLFANR